MIADKNLFSLAEYTIMQKGVLQAFEKENGKIMGRMLILPAAIPDEILGLIDAEREMVAFEASFDFIDTTIGAVLYRNPKGFDENMWFGLQREDSVEPTQDWIDFFLNAVWDQIPDEGEFHAPFFSFINEKNALTISSEFIR